MTHLAGTDLDRKPPPGKQWHDFVVCGNSHCQAEHKRKNPCKFVRLRNL